MNTLGKYMKSKIIVLGGAGHIGSRLVLTLRNYPEYKVKIMDITLGSDVKDGIKGKFGIVIFLAANLDMGEEGYQDNLEIIEAVKKYMDKHPDTYIIYKTV